MTEEEQRRDGRATDIPILDTARILAIMYTLGFFGIVLLMMTRGIPADNKDAINGLLGALTIVQSGIVQFYFGGSKASETMQQKLVSGKERADAAVQDIAKAAPAVAAAVVAAAAPTKNGHEDVPAKKDG
jgi:hypothetical protein